MTGELRVVRDLPIFQSITIDLLLCPGSFGRVMLARNKRSGEFFAMKRLKKADIIKLR